MERSPKIWTKVNGRLVGEEWIPAREYARRIGRPYTTVLSWMKDGRIPAIELGTGRYYAAFAPWPRAQWAFLKMIKKER